MAETIREASELYNGEIEETEVRMKVVGIGGAGINAVDRLKLDNLAEVDLAVISTDAQTLSLSPVTEKVMIGRKVTRGLSTGGEPELGKKSAEDDTPALRRICEGVDLIFIIAGLGGGTGSGAGPVFAKIAEETGAVVIAFVTQPFNSEGQRRQKQADEALAQLRECCHAVITLPNDVLLQQVAEDLSAMEALAAGNEWIEKGVRAIWAMLFQQGLINVDFAALRAAFREKGNKTLFSLGEGQGEDFVTKALADLDLCPLLHTPENKYSRRADTLIVNITGGPDLSLTKVNEIMEVVTEKFGSKEHTLLGAVMDSSMRQAVRITVIGTTSLRGGQQAYRSRKTPVVTESAPAAHAGGGVLARATDAPEKGKKKRSDDQMGFEFPGDEEQRGFFEKTAENLYEGEDLDKPTYLRRGIRIQLTP